MKKIQKVGINFPNTQRSLSIENPVICVDIGKLIQKVRVRFVRDRIKWYYTYKYLNEHTKSEPNHTGRSNGAIRRNISIEESNSPTSFYSLSYEL